MLRRPRTDLPVIQWEAVRLTFKRKKADPVFCVLRQ